MLVAHGIAVMASLRPPPLLSSLNDFSTLQHLCTVVGISPLSCALGSSLPAVLDCCRGAGFFLLISFVAPRHFPNINLIYPCCATFCPLLFLTYFSPLHLCPTFSASLCVPFSSFSFLIYMCIVFLLQQIFTFHVSLETGGFREFF